MVLKIMTVMMQIHLDKTPYRLSHVVGGLQKALAGLPHVRGPSRITAIDDVAWDRSLSCPDVTEPVQTTADELAQRFSGLAWNDSIARWFFG